MVPISFNMVMTVTSVKRIMFFISQFWFLFASSQIKVEVIWMNFFFYMWGFRSGQHCSRWTIYAFEGQNQILGYNSMDNLCIILKWIV